MSKFMIEKAENGWTLTGLGESPKVWVATSSFSLSQILSDLDNEVAGIKDGSVFIDDVEPGPAHAFQQGFSPEN